jgi:hypothetical protein
VNLNGVPQGSAFAWANVACNCNPTLALTTWTMTNLSGYVVGGSNTLTWQVEGIDELLVPKSTWNSAVMRVKINR